MVYAGIDFMEHELTRSFDEVTPEFCRKVEILEILLATFVEHVMNPELLDEIEQCGSVQIGDVH